MSKSVRFLILILVVLALALAACGGSDDKQASATYQTISVTEAQKQLQANPDAIFVDVRTAEEYATGHAEGTVLIPLDEVSDRAAAELPKDKDIYVICRSGNRSKSASETLISLGYEHVYNVDGGTNAWSSAGLPMSSN
ncbi:MAG TPA: rhodanese-like domain-containing protein [Aggregatilinea sp.]|jgi:rhodanese-related sulfurtransferase|uniref:rhodanese-like domain-containing protein n=1 Tax=Aggregatilinea sp. TaxID=2806333 RepID=UPI002CF70E12|nr:rhodanese-like domain-containing protein [Aggregatilinea sp.]HML20187.1 rhodanese-like domain-containing protein [Aggregatilinea sp.]